MYEEGFFFVFVKQKTAYEMRLSLVGAERGRRDRVYEHQRKKDKGTNLTVEKGGEKKRRKEKEGRK